MTLADIAPRTRVFIDANTLIYHFAPHPVLQVPCRKFLERVYQNDVSGFTSTHVLSNVAHRLMTLEAMAVLGWPAAGLVYRLQRQSAQIQRLTAFRQSVERIPALGIEVFPVAQDHVLAAVEISQVVLPGEVCRVGGSGRTLRGSNGWPLRRHVAPAGGLSIPSGRVHPRNCRARPVFRLAIRRPIC